jgi:hypothetical protein
MKKLKLVKLGKFVLNKHGEYWTYPTADYGIKFSEHYILNNPDKFDLEFAPNRPDGYYWIHRPKHACSTEIARYFSITNDWKSIRSGSNYPEKEVAVYHEYPLQIPTESNYRLVSWPELDDYKDLPDFEDLCIPNSCSFGVDTNYFIPTWYYYKHQK